MATAAKTRRQSPKNGSAAPRALRADACRNREAVLVAARVRFAEQGEAARIEDIAKDAGVGVGTVCRRFPSKEALIAALIEERFAGLEAAAREALESPDPWDGFEQFMRYSAEVMAGDRSLSELMDSRPDLMGSAAQEVGMLSVMDPLVRRAQDAGELRPDFDATDIPALICGLGRATRAPRGGKAMSWERYLEIMLAGLRTPAQTID